MSDIYKKYEEYTKGYWTTLPAHKDGAMYVCSMLIKEREHEADTTIDVVSVSEKEAYELAEMVELIPKLLAQNKKMYKCLKGQCFQCKKDFELNIIEGYCSHVCIAGQLIKEIEDAN